MLAVVLLMKLVMGTLVEAMAEGMRLQPVSGPGSENPKPYALN